MRRQNLSFLFILLAVGVQALAQGKVNRKQFFIDDKVVTLDLSTDLKRLVNVKKANDYQAATVSLHMPDSSVINAAIRLTARGEFRRQNCYVPSIKLDFGDTTSKSRLSSLRKLKLVVGCGVKNADEKLLLKEYLVYKIYNLLTDMSFRVRLLDINYTDTRGKIKPYRQYGFVIEDVDDMARRNKCREFEKIATKQERTDRQQMTLVAIFQYMIGNTDWAVPPYHNIKLIRYAKDSISFPYAVPYDFDFCGVVNADYAAPAENLDIKTVTERSYRGFPRTMEEIQKTLDIFRSKKDSIRTLVMNFDILDARSRKDVIGYLDEFFSMIEDKYQVQRIFINDARLE